MQLTYSLPYSNHHHLGFYGPLFQQLNFHVDAVGHLLNLFCGPAARALRLRSVLKDMHKTIAETHIHVQRENTIQQGAWACNTSSRQNAAEHDHA